MSEISAEVADVLRDLNRRPRSEFVAARTELARRLRADGRREAAAAVAALRKPSAAVWAVNQLVHVDADAVEELVAGGERLREAQRRALQGDPSAGAGVRSSLQAEQALLDRAVASASGALTAAGERPGPDVLARIRQTLHTAVTAGGSAAELLRKGRLEEELGPTGFEGMPAAAPRPRVLRRDAEDELREESEAASAAAEAADERARQASARADDAQREAMRLRQVSEAAAREAEGAAAAARTAESEARKAAADAARAARDAAAARASAAEAGSRLARRS